MTRLVSIGTMIEQAEGLLGTSDLNAWETGFITDIARRFKALPDLDRAKYAARFLTPAQYPASKREEAKKKLKSRNLHATLREIYAGMAEKSISTWAPYWPSAKAFTRHLRKTCTDIEVVSLGLKV